MINGFCGYGYIKERSYSGKRISDYLPYVYTRHEDDQGNSEKQAKQKQLNLANFCHELR